MTTAADDTAYVSPYLGLSSFGEGDRELFQGRTDETDELTQLVHRETISIVFGVSGLGKSSLLRAGLFPRLRETSHFPIVVRLAYGSADLVQQIRAAIAAQIEAHQIDAPPPAAGQTLWEYFHRTPFWDVRNRPQTPVIVIDQFEELFTLGARDPGREALLTELSDLVENRIPAVVREAGDAEALPPSYEHAKAKVVLSLREDYLARIEDLRAAMPSLGRGRFRLHPMSGNHALRAVRHAKTEHLIDAATAERVVRFVAGTQSEDASDAPLDELTVEPALLSLVCRALDERRQGLGEATISPDLLRGESGRILDDFYERSIADLDPRVGPYLEEHLLTPDGHRTTVAMAAVVRAPGMSDAVATLVDRRLLRIEERLGRPHVEVIHDVLTRVLIEHRERRLQASAQAQEVAARRLRSRRRRYALAAVAVVGSLLTVGLLWRAARAREQARSAKQAAAFEAKRRAEALDAAMVLFQEAQTLLAGDARASAMRLVGVAYGMAHREQGVTDELAVVVGGFTSQERALETTLQDHDADVTFIDFSPDGKELLTAGNDGKLVLRKVGDWNAPPVVFHQSDGLRATIEARKKPGDGADAGVAVPESSPQISPGERIAITGAVVSWAGRRVVTASDGAIVLWDLDRPDRAVASADADGALQVVRVPGSDHVWVVATTVYTKQLYRFDGTSLTPWPADTKETREVAGALFDMGDRGPVLSPAGDLLAIQTRAKGVVVYKLGDEPAVVHTFPFGEEAASMNPDDLPSCRQDPRSDMCRYERERLMYYGERDRWPEVGLAFSPDGAWLSTASSTNAVFSTKTWKEHELWSRAGSPSIVAFDASVAAGAAQAALVQLDGTLAVMTVDGVERARLPVPCEVSGSDVSGDQIGYVGSCGEVRLQTGEATTEGGSLPERQSPFDLTAAGKRLADTMPGGSVRVWRIDGSVGDRLLAQSRASEGDRPLVSKDVMTDGDSPRLGFLAAAGDGTRDRLVAAENVIRGGLGTSVAILDVSATAVTLVKDLDGTSKGDRTSYVSVSPSRDTLIMIGDDHKASVWKSDGTLVRVLNDPTNDPIVVARWGGDSATVVTGGKDGRLCVWSMAAGGEAPRCVNTGSADGINDLDVSKDGRRVIAALSSGRVVTWIPGAASVSDLIALDGEVGMVSFDRTGELAAISGRAGVGLVIEVARSVEVARFEDREGLRSIRFGGANGRLVIATSRAARAWLLDLDSPKVLDVLPLAETARSADLSADGQRLLLCEWGGYVQEWDLQRRALIGQVLLPISWGAERAGACAARYAPSGRIVTLKGETLSAWSPRQLQSALRAGGDVVRLAFTPDGRRLAVGDASELRVWSVADGELVASPSKISAWPRISADGTIYFAANGGLLVTIGADGQVRTEGSYRVDRVTSWIAVDPTSGRRLAVDNDLTFRIGTTDTSAPVPVVLARSYLNDAEFIDDDSLLVARADGSVARTDLDGNALVPQAQLPMAAGYVRTAVGGGAIAISARDVVVSNADGAPRVIPSPWPLYDQGAAWDARTDTIVIAGGDQVEVRVAGKPPRRFESPGKRYSPSFVALDPDRPRMLVASQDEAVVVSLDDEMTRTKLQLPTDVEILRAFFLTDDVIATVGASTVHVWNARTGRLIPSESATDAARAVGADRLWIVRGSVSLAVVRRGKLVVERDLEACGPARGQIMSVAASPDGGMVAAVQAADADRWICLWDAQSGKLLKDWLASRETIWRLSFRPDSRQLLSLSWSGTARVWDVPSGTLAHTLGREVVRAADFVAGVPYVVTVDDDSVLRVYDLDAKRFLEALSLPGSAPAGVERTRFAHIELDGRARQLVAVDYAGRVAVWSVPDLKLVRSFEVGALTVEDVALDPSGARIALIQRSSSAKIWSTTETTTPVRELATGDYYYGEASRLAFDRTGRWLAVTRGSTIQVWDAVRGRILRVFTGPVDIHAIAWSDDGRKLAVGGEGGYLKVFELWREDRPPHVVEAILQRLAPRKVDEPRKDPAQTQKPATGPPADAGAAP